ncbi:MAG: DNA gyrase inhibitor YacG [Sedimentisphaerales bacterium]
MEFYCPTCGKEVSRPSKTSDKAVKMVSFFTLFSKRCRLVDLNSWFESGYVISRPVEQQDEENVG